MIGLFLLGFKLILRVYRGAFMYGSVNVTFAGETSNFSSIQFLLLLLRSASDYFIMIALGDVQNSDVLEVV